MCVVLKHELCVRPSDDDWMRISRPLALFIGAWVTPKKENSSNCPAATQLSGLEKPSARSYSRSSRFFSFFLSTRSFYSFPGDQDFKPHISAHISVHCIFIYGKYKILKPTGPEESGLSTASPQDKLTYEFEWKLTCVPLCAIVCSGHSTLCSGCRRT